MHKRVGLYCWAGPGTIRMTRLKFFNPKIDKKSLMHSYDFSYLAKAKELFGITDVWSTYSWGFSPQTEEKDYKFLKSKVKNFKKLGLRVHAYIQGPTVVYSEFSNVDWYCKDNQGRDIWYYRGRKMVCINNPEFVSFVKKKIHDVAQLGVDGVFIDNIVMGQLPLPVFINKLPFVFAGCNCNICETKYRAEKGRPIPYDFEADTQATKEYLNWRVDCVTNFLTELSTTAHQNNLLFGSNSYDPHFSPKYVYGIDSKALDKIQDYHLFECLSFPTKGSKNARYIEKLTNRLKKPVFVVSYKYGIGLDKEYSQADINSLYDTQWKEKLHIGIKGSEYVTNGKWHNLYLEHFNKPKKNKPYRFHIATRHRIARTFKNILTLWPVKQSIKYFYNPSVRLIMENFVMRTIATYLAYTILVISRNQQVLTSFIKKYGLILFLLVILSIGYNLFIHSTTFAPYLEILKENIYLAAVFLIALKVVGLVWPPLSGGALSFLFLPVFGVVNTYLVDLVGTLIGATLSFFIARVLSRKFVTTLVGSNFLNKAMKLRIKPERELEATILASILLAGPMIEIVSYAAGFLKVKYRNMLVGVFIGHLVWTAAAFFIVKNIIAHENLLLSAVVALFGLFLALKLRRRYLSLFSE